MTCIVIQEGNHGNIGVAASYKSAIKFLIVEDWLSYDTEICSEGEEVWVNLI